MFLGLSGGFFNITVSYLLCMFFFNPKKLKICQYLVIMFSRYDSCMEATDSDHKPIKSVFNLDIAYVDKQTMRQKYVELMSSNNKVVHLLQELEAFPGVNINNSNIILQDRNPSVVKLQNRTEVIACFEIIGQAPNLSSTHFSAFPAWLKVSQCFV